MIDTDFYYKAAAVGRDVNVYRAKKADGLKATVNREVIYLQGTEEQAEQVADTLNRAFKMAGVLDPMGV